MDERQKHINEFDEIRSRIRSDDTEGDKNFIPSDSVWDNIVIGVSQQRSNKKYLWLFLFFFLLLTAIYTISMVLDGDRGQLSHQEKVRERDDLLKTWNQNESSDNSSFLGTGIIESSIVNSTETFQENISSNIQDNNSSNIQDNNAINHFELNGAYNAEEITSKSDVEKAANFNESLQVIKVKSDQNETFAEEKRNVKNPIYLKSLPLINTGIVHNHQFLNFYTLNERMMAIKPVNRGKKKIYLAGGVEYFRSGYRKTYQSSSDDHFELIGRDGWGIAFDFGVRLKRNLFLSAGIFYRKINFDAEYGFTMESQSMDIDRDLNGNYIASFNRSIPSLAGGLRTEIYTSYRGGAVIPAQDVGFNLSLGHAYRTISIPLTVQYVAGISDKINAEIGIGGSFTHRYVSIDTDINRSGYNQMDYVLNDIQFSAIENDVMPFKSNYFTGIVNVGFSFDVNHLFSLYLASRAERSLEKIYRDEKLTVNNSNLSLMLGLRYNLK